MEKLLLIASLFSAITPPTFQAIDIPNTITSPSSYNTSITRIANNDKVVTYTKSGGGSIRYYKIVLNYVNQLSAIEEQIQGSNVSYFTLPLEFYNYEPNANMGSATLNISWIDIGAQETFQQSYDLTNELSILAPDTLFMVHSVNSMPFLSSMSYNDIITFTFIIPTYDTVARAGYNDFEQIKNNGYSFWYYNHYAFMERFETTPLPPADDDGFFDGLFDLLEKGFNSIRNILSIKLFYNITLGTLLFMPLLFAIAYTLIKFLIGGG